MTRYDSFNVLMRSEPFGIHNNAADDEDHKQALDERPGNSSALGHAALLPAFGPKKRSHLPTPQSPIDVASYTSGHDDTYASPVRHPYERKPLPKSPAILIEPDVARDRDGGRNVAIEREDATTVSSASFMTPESSPVLPRKLIEPVTPVAGPSMPQNTHYHDHAVSPLAPSPVITTPVSSHSRAITPASRLSSPFQNRRSAGGRHAVKSPSSSPMPPLAANSPIPDVFSVPPPPSSPPPLATPVPQRAMGGEIHRIHLQLAADRAERLAETEARRPAYLVREKRPRSEADIPTLDELDAANATLGVADSPVKGRRLQLFQATSEETFEQSLLAGGYPGYGQSPAYKSGEPQTPTKGHSSLSNRALHWLQHATPGQPGPSTTPLVAIAEPLPTEEPEWLPSEQEVRKRRRLDAFREERREPGTKLYPAVVEGRGRLLLNVPPEGTSIPPDAPVKRKVNKRKRRRGGRRGAPTQDLQEDEPVQPNWPDAAFPWCLRVEERTHAETRKKEERLKWIERFLERESDSDSGEVEDDQELRPPLRSHENDQVAHSRGRGKMVPLRSNPDVTTRTHEENVLVPSDPADARAALLSKRSVRTLATRRKEQRSGAGGGAGEGELENVECIGCDRGDDGTELVLCDLCNVWYHLACIGIRHISELGREEDLWYCDRCLEREPAPPLEPTLVPTDDRSPVRRASRDSLFLQHPHPLLESPTPWGVVERAPPSTPVRGSGGAESMNTGMTRTFSTRSSRGAPSTPESSAKTVRVYDLTPNPFETFDPETPFDPTTTPSRGVKFSGGPPPTLGLSTPKGGVNLWAGRGGATPTPMMSMSKFAGGGGLGLGAGGESAGPRRLNWNDGVHAYSTPVAAGTNARSIYSASYLDDTPITRAPRTTALGGGVAGRRLWNSPGSGRRPATPDGHERERDRQMKRETDGDGDRDVAMETEA
ncbi:transcription factor [Ganoderma sinense ZZ0214-1]|uniref:Transcription factor n=1 Tax=Ganoderma sinense ZZ0214-1 TaxID=1077348 RepID=A0A2G8S838_9APHY|nr:transcription factor [Ganoderma sinense ZZ0214-1]